MSDAGSRFIFAAVAGLLTLAGCDRDAREAVTKAGAELRRETKATGDQVKQSLKEVGETTGQAIEDAAITAKVKAALHAEKDVKSRHVDVETFQGKVVLKGTVPDRVQAELATKVARSVEGVKAVDNRLAVN